MEVDEYIYTVGETAKETATFKVNGTLTDPTTVTATVESPSGTVTSPSPIHDSTGTYHVDVDLTEAGVWWVYIAGTGAAKGAKEDYLFVSRRETPGSNLRAEALVSYQEMAYALNRVGTSSSQEIRFIEDLINEASIAIAEYCNRQFTPERTAVGRWPLKSDPLATNVTKTFSYRGSAWVNLAPYELRTPGPIIVNTDLPTNQQLTLFAGDPNRAAEYRFEPAQKTTTGTYWWAILPNYDYGPISMLQDYSGGFLRRDVREVKISGDWGAPEGMIPASVQRACKLTVRDWFENPAGNAARRIGALDITEAVPEESGSLPSGARMLLQPHRRP